MTRQKHLSTLSSFTTSTSRPQEYCVQDVSSEYLCLINFSRNPLITQTLQPVPSLEEVVDIFQNATSSPSTLAPPSDPTYPSTSNPSSTSTYSAPDTKPNLVPVYIEVPADMLTPVAAYLKVAGESKHSFLLESVVGGENLARYSFVGAGQCSWSTTCDFATRLTLRPRQDGPNR